jgi:hypothetical protein
MHNLIARKNERATVERLRRQLAKLVAQSVGL